MALLTMKQYADIDSLKEYGYPVVYCNHCGEPCIGEELIAEVIKDDEKLYAQVCKEFGHPDNDDLFNQWTCRHCPNTSILIIK